MDQRFRIPSNFVGLPCLLRTFWRFQRRRTDSALIDPICRDVNPQSFVPTVTTGPRDPADERKNNDENWAHVQRVHSSGASIHTDYFS